MVEATALVGKRPALTLARPGYLGVVLPFSAVSIFACLTVAPIVNVDSTSLTSYFLWGVIPHYPPLYPIFTHAISALTSVLDWVGGGPVPHLSIIDPAPFTGLAAKFTLLAQHALTLASAAYLACRLRSDPLGRRIITALLYFNPLTLQMAHAIQSEALVIPAVYAASAEAFTILARPSQVRWHHAAFLVWTLLASLARHPAIILGALLPIGLGIQALAAATRQKWADLRSSLTTLCLICAGLAGVQAVNMLASRAVMVYMGVEPISVPGRAFTYRLTEVSAGTSVLPGLDESQFRRAVEYLKSTAYNTELEQDIGTIVNTPGPWTGPYAKIYEDVKRACPDCGVSKISAETDRRLNRVMMHAIFNMNPDLIRDVALRAMNFVAPYAVEGQKEQAERQKRQALGMELRPWAPNEKFDPYSGFLWEGNRIEVFISDSGAFLRSFLFSISCGAVLISIFLRSQWPPVIPALGLLGTAAVYSVLVSFVTTYLPRYGFFVDLLSISSLMIVASKWTIPNRHQRTL